MTRVPSHLRFFSDSHGLVNEGRATCELAARNDAIVESFGSELGHWQSLTAMTLGSVSYRFANLALRQSLPFAGAFLSPVLSLAAEVGVYESAQRALLSASSQASHELFSWSGEGGLWQGLRQSYLNFAFLKIGGKISSRNLLFSHFAQAGAMVAGHSATAALGWVAEEQGSLLERLVNAEAMNLNLGLAMGWVHTLLPALRIVESRVERQAQRTHFAESFTERESTTSLQMAAGEVSTTPFEKALQSYFTELRHADLRVRLRGLDSLAIHGPQARIVERVLPLLKDPHPEVRLRVIELFNCWHDEGCLESLTSLLDDPDPRVQIAAEHALRQAGFYCLEDRSGAARFPESEAFLESIMGNFALTSFANAGFMGHGMQNILFEAPQAAARQAQSVDEIALPARRDPSQAITERSRSYRGASTLAIWRAEARAVMSEEAHAEVVSIWLDIERNLEDRIVQDSARLKEVLENAYVEERFGALAACRKAAFTNRLQETLKYLDMGAYPHLYEILLEQILEHSTTEFQARSLLDQYYNFCKALGACGFADRFFSSFDRSVLYGENEAQSGERWAFDTAVEDLVEDIFARIYTDFLTRGISARAAIAEVETLIQDGSLHRSVVYRWNERRSELSLQAAEPRLSPIPSMTFEMAFLYLTTLGEVSSPLEFREPCEALLEVARKAPADFKPQHWQILWDVFQVTRLFEVNEIFHELFNASDLFSIDSPRAYAILQAHLDYERGVIETHPLQIQGEEWIDPSWQARQRVYILAKRYPLYFPAKYLEIDDSAWVRAGTRPILAVWLEEILKLFEPIAQGDLSEAIGRSLIAGGYGGVTPLPDGAEESVLPILLTRMKPKLKPQP